MKKKTYTVSSTGVDGKVPFIRIAGKWLSKKGINIGDKLSLIESENMIILLKENKQK